MHLPNNKCFFAERPDPPKQPTSGRKSSRWMEILWRPSFNGHSSIKSYTVEYKRHSELWSNKIFLHVLGNTTKTVIGSLSPGVHYNFRVIATNHIGSSEPSDNNVFRTNEEGMVFAIHVFQEFVNYGASYLPPPS